MNRRPRFRDQKGFGLITLVVMLAVMVVLAQQTALFFSNFMRSQAALESQEDLVSIRQYLETAVDCAQTLQELQPQCCNPPDGTPEQAIELLRSPTDPPTDPVLVIPSNSINPPSVNRMGRNNQIQLAAFCGGSNRLSPYVRYVIGGNDIANPQDFFDTNRNVGDLWTGPPGFCAGSCP